MSFNGKEIAAAYNGNGVDGDVTVSTSITLTRDMYYRSLIVTGAGTINTAGYRIFSRTFIENNGVIHQDGTSATTTSAPVDAEGTIRRGVQGTNGAIGNSATTSSSLYGLAKHGRGGVGGTGSGGTGGATGTVATLSSQFGGPNPMIFAAIAIQGSFPYLATTKLRGATGGSGGGGNGALAGGGGGAGAGTLILISNKIFGTGTMRANGGNGANASNLNTGGGGGGGGGTSIMICANDVSQTSLVFQFNGGTGGTGNGTGTAGANGVAGSGSYNIRTVL